MDKLTNNHNISFTSLRVEKQIGEKILHDLRKEMGYIESGTRLTYRRLDLQESKRLLTTHSLMGRILKKEVEMDKICYDDFLLKKVSEEKFKSLDDFIYKLKANIKSKGNKGNCWEHMMLVYDKLIKLGQTPYNIKIVVENDEGFYRNHFTTVFGLKKGAKINDPKTWGSKAMIVDAWSKMVLPAKEALDRLLMKMIRNQKDCEIIYYPISKPVKIGSSKNIF